MSRAGRHVVECTWRGRVVHRAVTMRPRDFTVTSIQFTDNTTMSVRVRKCERGELVKEIRQYDELLRKVTGMTGHVRVADLS